MKRWLSILLCGVWPLAAMCMAEETGKTPIKVLIVDGFGNHDWKRTTRLIREILEPAKLFHIEVSTAPASPEESAYSAWQPDFSKFDVVIQTCNDINQSGPAWPEKVRRDFEMFVTKGGGVFVFHSGNNAFVQWDAYNSMIGLGWRNRDFGTAIRIGPDESLQRMPPGEGEPTHHGARTDRAIHRIGEHPIHAGLPRVWMTPQIEVYTYARGPAKNIHILSWAEDPNGNGRWPTEWTVDYGKGKIYTSTFGHVWKDEKDPVDMRCAGFQTLLIRAVQWLAGRDFSQKVPADFPSNSAVSLRQPPDP